jgi:DNA (cytosine-5)-methyltransferase 1
MLTSLELFAGAGGIALGVHQANFAHVGLIEINTFAAQTLRYNSQNVLGIDSELVINCDASMVNYHSYAGNVDFLTGGPPCQPFSNAGKKLGPDDNRNTFPVFFNAMSIIRPKAILIENVKGLLQKEVRDYFNYILKCLQYPLLRMQESETWQEHFSRLQAAHESDFLDDEQYIVDYQLVDTADYGIPQRRERVIIFAFRRDLGIQPFKLLATHSKQALLWSQWVTGEYWDKYNIPPEDCLGTSDRQIVNELKNKLTHGAELPWKTVRDALHDLPEPVLRGQKEIIPNHIQHPGARIYPNHIGSYWDYPAKALKAGTHGTPGGENMLRINREGSVRYFTTREAARLQTFPDDWHFQGSWGACIKQLGNAVPVDLICLFASKIHSRLSHVLELTTQGNIHG